MKSIALKSSRRYVRQAIRVRRAIREAGHKPIAAEYDVAGNCKTCGEAGRCPGWHTPAEVRRGGLVSAAAEAVGVFGENELERHAAAIRRE